MTRMALITGASSGIGSTFARHLARTGHGLVLVARSADRLDALAAELREAHDVPVEVLAADLESAAGIDAVSDRLAAEPAIDLFVNNAGFATMAMVGAFDRKVLDAMIRLNVVAFSQLADAAMAAMRPRGTGTIINVGSGTLVMRIPGYAGYGASKAYVTYFTRTMQAEAEGSGVRVQLLIPGVVATDFHRVAGNDLEQVPDERIMQADDLVVASLRALEMGEPVCIPSLPDVADWEAWEQAEQRLTPLVSRNRTAPRYH